MDGIDRLRKKLYSRTGKGLGAHKRRVLRQYAQTARRDWEKEPEPIQKGKKRDTMLTALLVGSALFFALSLVIASFFFFAERNTVSSDNIKVEIQGPANIGGGEELVLQLLITNENPTPIQNVDLLVEYPEGTRSATDTSEEVMRTRESLDTLRSGERVQRTARAVLFGEEGSTKSIRTTIEYRVEGSNAIFYKEQTYEVTLSNAPLTLSVDSIEEISSGQDIEFTVTIHSNSESAIQDVLLVGDYPFGFEYSSATPTPFAKTNVWELGDIEPESKKTIRIRGKVFGENEEERVFRFIVGTRSPRDDEQIATDFFTVLQSVLVQRPFIGVLFAVNGDTDPDPIVKRDDRVRVDITWFNNLSEKIFDGEIEVNIAGAILDERSVSVQNGFYRSSDNTVLFNRDTLSALGTLEEGDRGTVTFSFLPLPQTSNESFRTPSVVFDVAIRGQRLSERNVPEVIESTEQRILKVASDVVLTPTVRHFSGSFGNTGPIPPRAEQKTTYTITWVVNNSTNPLGDVSVVGSLPSYVRYVGTVSPTGARVNFSEVGGQVRWNVGTMGSYDSREVSFQVELLPSLSQVGTEPVLMSNQRVEGVDTFTTTRVSDSGGSLTTVLSGESGAPPQSGKVIE